MNPWRRVGWWRYLVRTRIFVRFRLYWAIMRATCRRPHIKSELDWKPYCERCGVTLRGAA